MEMTTWVNGWGIGVTHPLPTETQWMKDMTVRYVLPNTLDAAAIRLHFANWFGEEPVVITRATVARSAGKGVTVCPETVTTVTFQGDEKGTILPGGDLTSDDIPLTLRAGENAVVSLYFADFTHVTTGMYQYNPFMVREFCAGDHVADADFALLDYGKSETYAFLWSADFLTTPDSRAIVTFGDSITAQMWPDILAQRLLELGIHNRAIVRRAVSGSRVLGAYPCVSYLHYGPDGAFRFEREVLHEGVSAVIIMHGINDFIHPDDIRPFRPMSNLPTPEQMEQAQEALYVRPAAAHGLKTYLATILPFKGWRTYDEERNRRCQAVNDWMRGAPANGAADGVIDFARAVADPDDPDRFLPAFNSGDSLHPSMDGYRAMAYAIDERILRE